MYFIDVVVELVEIQALDGNGVVPGEEERAVDDGVRAVAHLLHEPVVGRVQRERRRRRGGRAALDAPVPAHVATTGRRRQRRRPSDALGTSGAHPPHAPPRSAWPLTGASRASWEEGEERC